VPIYDYVCSDCGHRFEVLHGLNEVGPRQCPACGGAVSRAFAPPTIVFKGSGWARVDRRATPASRKDAKARVDDGPPPTSESTPGAGAKASEP
jgi:putative FmdB family regulatory protein